MKEVKVVLKDDALYTAVEAEAAKTGQTLDEIVTEALESWLTESELDAIDAMDAEAAQRDWEQHGGMEAGKFFDLLRQEARK